MRDYALGTTFDVKFTTRAFTTGAPFSLSGGTVAAYPDNSTTEITAGITLTADFDARTGLNNVRVVATGGNGYASGSNYSLVLTAGTVNGVSVVGEVVGEFSLEAQSPLRPTTAGRTLDVSATGEGGVDWANVGGATTAVALTNTTVGTLTTYTGNTPQTGDAFARLGAPAGASTAADIAAVKTDTAAIKTKTDSLTFTGAGRVDANVEAINNSTTADQFLERAVRGNVLGTVGAAATTTSLPTSSLSPASTVADQFKGRILTFDNTTATAALQGQATDITANTAGGTLTVTALTTAPASGDTFTIT